MNREKILVSYLVIYILVRIYFKTLTSEVNQVNEPNFFLILIFKI